MGESEPVGIDEVAFVARESVSGEGRALRAVIGWVALASRQTEIGSIREYGARAGAARNLRLLVARCGLAIE